MKKSRRLLTVIVLIVLFVVSPSLAQQEKGQKGSGGWGAGSLYRKLFNPSTVETIRGEVVDMRKVTPAPGMCEGFDLLVKTEKETVTVNLGPVWFIENQDIKFEPKDKVEVTGSRVSFGGKAQMIASQIKKGDYVLEMRDRFGSPVWSFRQKPQGE